MGILVFIEWAVDSIVAVVQSRDGSVLRIRCKRGLKQGGPESPIFYLTAPVATLTDGRQARDLVSEWWNRIIVQKSDPPTHFQTNPTADPHL